MALYKNKTAVGKNIEAHQVGHGIMVKKFLESYSGGSTDAVGQTSNHMSPIETLWVDFPKRV